MFTVFRLSLLVIAFKCLDSPVAGFLSPISIDDHVGSEAATVNGVPIDAEASSTTPLLEADDNNKFRELAFRISSSFSPRNFTPATPLLANRHVQTISGAVLRNDKSCRYVNSNDKAEEVALGAVLDKLTSQTSSMSSSNNDNDKNSSTWFWDYRQRVDTPDGDFFHVDHKKYDQLEKTPAKGLVIILHGLQSNSNSTLVMDMATAYNKFGFDVACINFRSCSGVPNDSLKAYHLGFTDDLKLYLDILNSSNPQQQQPPCPIFISGKSLGANVVLKALGELGVSAFTDYNVYGAAVNCAPFDNERNANFLLRGFSKVVYNGMLLKSLKDYATSQLERFRDTNDAQKVDYNKLIKATTISEFDDAFIAPIFGFDNYLDYYNKTSCLNYLSNIRVPTFILNSADDPFMDPDFFPWEYGCDSITGRQNQSPIKMARTANGGHLGYMFHQLEEDEEEYQAEDVSFMPLELARFVNHVFERRRYLEKGGMIWDYWVTNNLRFVEDDSLA